MLGTIRPLLHFHFSAPEKENLQILLNLQKKWKTKSETEEKQQIKLCRRESKKVLWTQRWK